MGEFWRVLEKRSRENERYSDTKNPNLDTVSRSLEEFFNILLVPKILPPITQDDDPDLPLILHILEYVYTPEQSSLIKV